MRKRKIGFGILLAGLASGAGAHDLWLVADRYRVSPGEEVVLRANTGMKFPVSTNAVKPDRVERWIVLSPKDEVNLTAFREEDTSLIVPLTFSEPGIHLVGFELKPKGITLTGEEFAEYLGHEGLEEILRLRKELGEEGKTAEEVYSKHVKALFRVGEGGNAGYDRRLGMKIEIVPLENPFDIAPGGDFPVEVLFEGKPLPDAGVSLGQEGLGEGEFSFTGQTDSNGRIRVPIPKPGHYFLHVIHMVRVKDEGYDWRSYWATLTLRVKP